jgi:hypothetical protein
MKIKYWTKLINLLILVLVLSIGCKPKMISGGVKNNNSDISNGNFYTSFYVNDSVSTYFIKPLKYKFQNSDLFLDITYQQINQNIENVIVNFSILTAEKIKNSTIESLKINSIDIKDYKILYNDYSNKKFDLRISVNNNISLLKSFNLNSKIEIVIEKKNYVFVPNSKAEKNLIQVKKLIE